MALILDGTNGLSDVDGSAATPAIRGSDANTGVFFGTDIVGVSTGGSERMRVDASGNVGIGTSSPAVNGLEISRDTGAASPTPAELRLSSTTSTTGFSQSDPWARLSFYSADVSGPAGASVRAAIGSVMDVADTGGLSALTFYTNGGTLTERARIDSSGNLLVGTTTGAYKLSVTHDGQDFIANFVNSNATNPFGVLIGYSAASPNNTVREFLSCSDSTAARMQVRSNGGIANFSGNNVNLSDRREKTNFAPAKSYLETICAIPVQTFNYIDQNMEEDPGLTLGVVAQDVQEVAPELVMESNWGTEENPKMRLSVYQTDLQYALMKCIQEQQAIITALTARVEALEGAQA